MGIVKISEQLHEQTRITAKVMTRSINAQAEHWMKIGMLAEQNPDMSYTDVLKHMMAEVRQAEALTNKALLEKQAG